MSNVCFLPDEPQDRATGSRAGPRTVLLLGAGGKRSGYSVTYSARGPWTGFRTVESPEMTIREGGNTLFGEEVAVRRQGILQGGREAMVAARAK